jgi:hypothetical protein
MPSSPTAPSPTTTVLPGPTSAATAPNQPVPRTSEAASRAGTRSFGRRCANDCDVEVEGVQYADEVEVQLHVHLGGARSLDAAEVDDSLRRPAELAQQARDCVLSAVVLAGDEEVVLPGYAVRLDHHLHEHGVERLDHAGVGERALDLLTEAVGVGDEEPGRHPLGEVEREPDVDEHFPCQVRRADGFERRQPAGARRRVDDELISADRTSDAWERVLSSDVRHRCAIDTSMLQR